MQTQKLLVAPLLLLGGPVWGDVFMLPKSPMAEAGCWLVGGPWGLLRLSQAPS